MPDPRRDTVSATEISALFGANPYLTRWMLLRRFIHGDDISSPAHNRMDWGTKLQPLVLAQAAEELHLEVKPNAEDVYLRRGNLGCTRDAEVICPDRGPGALETKCVFDHRTWMQHWDGGKTLPRHIELQLQQQMYVGDGVESYAWGCIAVWVCGEMFYFERAPIPEVWETMTEAAETFFKAVAAGDEGDPFGVPVEMPLLNKLFAPKPGKVIELTSRDDAEAIVGFARGFVELDARAKETAKQAAGLKAKLRALIGDAEEAVLLDGSKIRQKTVNRKGYTVEPSSYNTFSVYVPRQIDDDVAGDEAAA
jgi:hypothetical protein